MTSTTESLPVIIAGAGPCGLVTALVLQNAGVPFVVVERASPAKLLADVGSGYDVQPMAMRVLKHLGVPYQKYFSQYAGIHQLRLDTGSTVRSLSVGQDMPGFESWAARRSSMQRMLVQALEAGGGADVRCGSGVASYTEGEDRVMVELSNGSELVGRALLACDGIKSAVRAQLHRRTGDALRYCGVRTWWGRAPMAESSRLEQLCGQTQLHAAEGLDFVWYMAAGRAGGAFMGAPSRGEAGAEGEFMWSYSCEDGLQPEAGEDLTRRGGITGESAKAQLRPHLAGSCDFPVAVVEATAPEDVTMVGLYDRERLDLPFVSPGGRVALLGDAAHPQTPFLDQGVSMAIVDAFVCATRLAGQPEVPPALRSYGSLARSRGCIGNVEGARRMAWLSTTSWKFVRWSFRTACALLPVSFVVGDVLKNDQTNKDFLEEALAEFAIHEG